MDKLVMTYEGVKHCSDKDRGCEGCPYFPIDDCEEALRQDIMAMLQRLGKCANCKHLYYVTVDGDVHDACPIEEGKRNPFGNCPSWEAKLE